MINNSRQNSFLLFYLLISTFLQILLYGIILKMYYYVETIDRWTFTCEVLQHPCGVLLCFYFSISVLPLLFSTFNTHILLTLHPTKKKYLPYGRCLPFFIRSYLHRLQARLTLNVEVLCALLIMRSAKFNMPKNGRINYQRFFDQLMHNWIVLKTILNLH